MESEQLAYLKEQINKRIKGIDSSRIYYRKISFWSYMSISIFAAISTIILGLNLDELGEVPRIIAIIITGIISIISAYNSFFDNRELWIVNNIALNRLYKLRFEMDFDERDQNGITQEMLGKYKDSYQSILDDLNKKWSETRGN